MPQTQSQIAALLAERGLRPEKRHGQHFLIDLNLMRILVDEAGVTAEDVVLEVGCGTGSLTELLCGRAFAVIAVDIDPRMIDITGGQLAGRSNLTLIHADILRGKNRLNPQVTEPTLERAAGRRLLLIANLPYGAGTPVVANIVTAGLPFAGIWATMQKEVAERLAAPAGGKTYGPVTVMVQSAADVSVFRRVPAAAFWPRPEVESAMVSVIPNRAKAERIAAPAVFEAIVEGVFTQRRKTLRSAVRAIRDPVLNAAPWAELLAQTGIDDGLRPDQISVEQYIALAAVAGKWKAAGG